MTSWEEISAQVGYEGAAAIVVNSRGEVLFLLSKKDGKLQAEIAGGKPEPEDGGESCRTAIRELQEEAGVELTVGDFVDQFTTKGGLTGFPSIQHLTRPLDDLVVKPREKFEDYVFSKITNKEGKWYAGDIPIRKFNGFFLDQNKERLADYIT